MSAIEDAKEAVITKELGQESTSKKGQAEEELEESESTCSPLTLPGVQPEKFKEKMEYRNQVAKQDQLEKLQENRKGQALRLIPETTEDIDAAWVGLKDAFGDVTRVLQHRLNLLGEMDDLPAKNDNNIKITRCTITSERKHVFASNSKFQIGKIRKQLTARK